jgi:hypothetical protein
METISQKRDGETGMPADLKDWSESVEQEQASRAGIERPRSRRLAMARRLDLATDRISKAAVLDYRNQVHPLLSQDAHPVLLGWEVEGQGRERYTVTLRDGLLNCTCPDHTHRENACKHILSSPPAVTAVWAIVWLREASGFERLDELMDTFRERFVEDRTLAQYIQLAEQEYQQHRAKFVPQPPIAQPSDARVAVIGPGLYVRTR